MMAEVSERRRADVALRILAEVTAILSRSLEYEVTLAKVARSLVPRLADACVIQLVRRGELFRVAAVGRDEDARPGSSLVAPLIARNDTLGFITISSFSRGHSHYGDRDRELLQEIAARAALAVEHARLHRDVELQRAQLRVIADTSRALAPQLDLRGVARAVARVLRATVLVGPSPSADGAIPLRVCGSVDAAVEARAFDVVARPTEADFGAVGERVLISGEPELVTAEGVDGFAPHLARLARELAVESVLVTPLIADGRAIGVMGILRDAAGGVPVVDDELALAREIGDRAAVAFERARLFEAQKRFTDQLRLLADAGTLLAQSLDVGPTLDALARLALGRFADACSVDLLEDGKIASMAVAVRDAALEQPLRRALDRYTAGGCPPGLRRAFDSGRARLIAAVDHEALAGFAVDPPHLDALLGLGLRSVLVVPLVARGGPVGVLTLWRTSGAAYDEEDRALAEELGRRAALAIDNAHLFKQAKEAIAVRDEFLAIASHELNTPLTPLKMQLDSLRRATFTPARMAEKLEAASRQITRLAKLVSELLDVSRISGGRLHLERESLELREIVCEVVSRVSEEAERAGSPLSVRADHSCRGMWDRMRMDQVLTNILTNSIKYGAGKPIEVELQAREGGVRIVVRDQGIGIAPEHQRRIFERFERAASARHYGGFGLGLWIARQIVEASGGKITVDSVPGQGSTFMVDLPCDETS
jgi:signal transduction histidine kinase